MTNCIFYFILNNKTISTHADASSSRKIHRCKKSDYKTLKHSIDYFNLRKIFVESFT